VGQITLVLTEEAESLLRGKNNRKGDMGKFVSELIVTSCAQSGKEEKK
jgi:hypothetical protein